MVIIVKKFVCEKAVYFKMWLALLQFFKSKPSQNWKLQGNLLYFKLKLFCTFEDLHLPIYCIEEFDFDLEGMD